MKRALAFFFVLAIGLISFACAGTKGFEMIHKGADNLALHGYDTVAYFTENRAVEGKTEFAFEWGGATWRFVSAENRDRFSADPEKYAPQFGGYCAYAVSRGYTANGDPNVWKIVDGKLYVNYSAKAKSVWEEKQAENIEVAQRNWVEFQTKKPEYKE
jgi:YHS domain-containing protein